MAGVLSLADAATLIAARGRLMQALPGGGAMISLQASEAEVRALLTPYEGKLEIAGLNGPLATVISGDAKAAKALARQIEAMGRKTTPLKVSHAFHSPQMDGMLEEFRQAVQGLAFHAPRIPIISNVTGQRAGVAELR